MESGEHATSATEGEATQRPTSPPPLHTDELLTAHFPLPLPAPERRTVEPLHLLCFDNVWYLYLWDPLRKDIRRFALNRMLSAERTGRSIRRRKFDIEKELADTLGVTSGTPQSVRLRFKGKAARIVTERYWHESQQFTAGPSPEWPLEFALRVAHTPELESFIRQFGGDVEVIEPATLHKAIVKEARCVVARAARAGQGKSAD